MLRLDKTLLADAESWDFNFEFWPRQAESYLEQGEYSKAIEICEKNIGSESKLLSAKLIYAKALIGENRSVDATEQLFQALSLDPDNLAALKLLGDIQYGQNDFVSAMASYSRILELDPDCRGLQCSFTPNIIDAAPVLIFKGSAEPQVEAPAIKYLVASTFRTETVGDIYLKQGQVREALEIFRELAADGHNNRIVEKLALAEKMAAQKERRAVE